MKIKYSPDLLVSLSSEHTMEMGKMLVIFYLLGQLLVCEGFFYVHAWNLTVQIKLVGMSCCLNVCVVSYPYETQLHKVVFAKCTLI